MPTYRALAGLNYPDARGRERRVEAGEETDDIPARSVPWLLEQGLIEEVAPAEAPEGED